LNRPFAVALLWGAELAALLCVGVAFGFEGAESPLLLGGAAAAAVGLAVCVATTGVDRDQADALVAAEMSPATPALAIALVLLVVSAELGLWLTLIASGLLGGALTGLVRELRAERRFAARLSSGDGGD
jgi:hypothetical protein